MYLAIGAGIILFAAIEFGGKNQWKMHVEHLKSTINCIALGTPLNNEINEAMSNKTSGPILVSNILKRMLKELDGKKNISRQEKLLRDDILFSQSLAESLLTKSKFLLPYDWGYDLCARLNLVSKFTENEFNLSIIRHVSTIV